MNLQLLCVFFMCFGGKFSIIQARHRAYSPVEDGRRVLGGTPATHAWQWFALLHSEGSPPSEFFCGGTLVSSRHVVTAAHCFNDVDYPLAATFNVLNRCAENEENRLQIPVEKVVNHPSYGDQSHDIALVVLLEPAHGLQTAALPQPVFPSSSDDAWWEPAEVGRRALIVGFGIMTDIPEDENLPCYLQEAKVRVLSSERCELAELPTDIAGTMLCAGKRSGGVDTCQGDSGGGLLVNEDGKLTLIGVVSNGNGCGIPGYPGIYTRVAYFMPWLHEKMVEGRDITRSSREDWSLSKMFQVLNDFVHQRVASTLSDIMHIV